jgi:hypothetical protein
MVLIRSRCFLATLLKKSVGVADQIPFRRIGAISKQVRGGSRRETRRRIARPWAKRFASLVPRC